jgi:hypothetical protein
MYFLTVISKLDEPFNRELVFWTSSTLSIGCIVVIGLGNKGFGIKYFSNSFILSFKTIFFFYVKNGFLQCFSSCIMKLHDFLGWNPMKIDF